MPTIQERLASLDKQVRESASERAKAEARREGAQAEVEKLEKTLLTEFGVEGVEEAEALLGRMEADVESALKEVSRLL